MLSIIFAVAAVVNSVPYLLSGISPVYAQSSDSTVHVVQWQEFSGTYAGNFDNDVMFQNYQAQPTGTLFVDKVLVRISEFFKIDLLDWSIIVSALSLALFLSGVYFLVLYSTKKSLLGLLIALISIIPVISLGLSSWGSLVIGFVPKEISVAISVWLTLVYLWGVSTDSKPRIAGFFALLGLFANWYPPVFFHYALVLITVEVLRQRAITKELVLYGVIFLLMAPVALFDIFIKAGHFTTPVLSIIINHYGVPLHSLSYLLLHYLRKQIIYVALVGGLWYMYRRILKREYSPLLKVWYYIWWSTLVWSLIGVGIEVFYPLYMKYLISRISVWFYLASMIIIAATAYEIWFAKFERTLRNSIAFSVLLIMVLVIQTSILNVYRGLKDSQKNGADYAQYLSVVTRIQSLVPTRTLVLANPDGEANTIRAYGGTGTYVTAKDGNVTLFDGASATTWFERYTETQAIFAKKDFLTIRAFAIEKHLQFYLFDTKDIQSGTSTLAKMTILQSGTYGLAKLY